MSSGLETGDIFSAEINMVTRNGLATVRQGRETISIGPVTCEKGTLVHVKYLGEEQVNDNTTANIGLCLTEHVLADDYAQYIENLVDHLTPDQPPASGEVMYAKIDEIEGQDIGIAVLGGKRITLGPVRAQVGDLVQISGVNESTAEVLTESAKADHYEVRFNILTGQTDRLPISVDEEYTTIITDLQDDVPISRIMEVPIAFPEGTAAVGQKADIRVLGFERDRAVGEILETYDEVGRIENLGHWARMQWLRKVGFGDDPLHNFAAQFLGVNPSVLPTTEDRLRSALIAEAIRLCLEEKATHSDEGYPRAHVTGIRHWVTHKLSTVLGDPNEDDDTDWFREVLVEGKGQTLSFIGDVLELSHGYYAMGPTRVIMTDESEGILVSGRSTSHFQEMDLDVRLRGTSRRLTDTSEVNLRELGLNVQSLSDYLGTDGDDTFDENFLTDFIQTRPSRDWAPEAEWEAYAGYHGYGFDWGEDRFRVQTTDGHILSLWRVPVEYGADEYQLRIETVDGNEPDQMVGVPSRYYKHVCLLMDELSGRPREVVLSSAGDEVRLSAPFAPPRAQMRWLYAVGARWEDPRGGQLHWRFNAVDSQSIEQAFDELAVTVKDQTSGLTH
jgi:hypothetical protein